MPTPLLMSWSLVVVASHPPHACLCSMQPVEGGPRLPLGLLFLPDSGGGSTQRKTTQFFIFWTSQCIDIITLIHLYWLISDVLVLSVGPTIGSVEQEVDIDGSIFGSLPTVQTSVQLAFDTVLFGFALFALSRHVLEARALTGGWLVNPLVKFLVADQTLYFMCYALWQALTIPETLPTLSTTQSDTLDVVSNVLFAFIVIFGPRMVIRLRAEELRSREGTFQEELSTIRFGSGNPSALSSMTGEGEGQLEIMLGGDSVESRGGIVGQEVC
ncbi:hypothetical protein BV22DRAFT_1029667 [Leucogyrophana mollusca]|uniref:Uncharacterized protein n=1 Tax=Leucogyrophana mollusca TaxID=85980 RepID=A0ACB8BTD5_9AGAM|nr:hypothetical protein BV22DRAFT_1029667 [Leucogyrophana mollusca]